MLHIEIELYLQYHIALKITIYILSSEKTLFLLNLFMCHLFQISTLAISSATLHFLKGNNKNYKIIESSDSSITCMAVLGNLLYAHDSLYSLKSLQAYPQR